MEENITKASESTLIIQGRRSVGGIGYQVYGTGQVRKIAQLLFVDALLVVVGRSGRQRSAVAVVRRFQTIFGDRRGLDTVGRVGRIGRDQLRLRHLEGAALASAVLRFRRHRRR